MVQVDIVLLSQVHDCGSFPCPGERSPAAASSNLSNEVLCSGVGNPSKVKWYPWLTGGHTCSGTQTNCPVSYPIQLFVSAVEHVALVSREWWQSWRPQLSQFRTTGWTVSPVKTSGLKHNMMVTTKNIVSGGAGRRSCGAYSEATSVSSVLGLAGSRVWAVGSGLCG